MHLAIAAGGIAGAFARYAAGSIAVSWLGASFPWGTLFINVAGSCALGFLMQLLPATTVSPAVRAALTVGFCGGFTTFSTFGFEVVTLGGARPVGALVYVLASVVFGLAAMIIGMEAAGLLVTRRGAPARTVPPGQHETASDGAQGRRDTADATTAHHGSGHGERRGPVASLPAARPDAEGRS